MENKIEQVQYMDVSVRAKKFVDNIVDALDITAPRRKFRILKIWEEKSGFQMKSV